MNAQTHENKEIKVKKGQILNIWQKYREKFLTIASPHHLSEENEQIDLVAFQEILLFLPESADYSKLQNK